MSDFGGPRYALNTTTMPTDSSTDAGTVQNTRAASITKSNVIPNLGDRYYVKARQFTGASGGGVGGPYITAEVERQNKSKTKTMRMAHTMFVPFKPPTDEVKFELSYATQTLKPAGRDTLAWVPLPQGATITAMRFRGSRVNGNGGLSVGLYEVTGDETTALVGSLLSHSTTGYQTVSQSLSKSVGSSTFVCVVTFDNNAATNADDCRFSYVEFDYSVPNLETTL